MKLGKLCEDLFCQNGQIGYYLLYRRLVQERGEAKWSSISI